MKIVDDPKNGKRLNFRLHNMFPTYSEFEAYCELYPKNFVIGQENPLTYWRKNPKVSTTVSMKRIKL